MTLYRNRAHQIVFHMIINHLQQHEIRADSALLSKVQQSCENNHSWYRQSSSSKQQHPFERMIYLPSSFSTNVKKRNRNRLNRTCYRSSHALNTRKDNETLSLTQVSRIQCCVASKFRHRSQLSLAKHTHTVVNRNKDRD